MANHSFKFRSVDEASACFSLQNCKCPLGVHSRRYWHVRSLVRYPQHRTLPRPTETVCLSPSCVLGSLDLARRDALAVTTIRHIDCNESARNLLPGCSVWFLSDRCLAKNGAGTARRRQPTERRAIAGPRAFNGLCDDEGVPLICPTCQVFAQGTSVPATACYFAWGCFRYFWLGAQLRRDILLEAAHSRMAAQKTDR